MDQRIRKPAGLRPWLPLVGWLVLAAIGCAWVWSAASHDRDEAMERGRLQARALADLAAEHAGRIFEGADMALRAVESRIGPAPDWDEIAASREVWQQLHDWSDALSGVPRLLVTDQNGRIRLHTDVFPSPTVNLADREHFRHHLADPSPRAFVGQPVIGRVTGQPAAVLSRRLNRADGGFAGMAVANLSPEMVEKFYATFATQPGTFVSLARADGMMLARHPHRDGLLGSYLSKRTVFPSRDDDLRGEGLAASPVDGTVRLVAYRRVDHYGLVAVAGVAMDEALAEWRRSYQRTGLLLALVVLSVTALVVVDTRRRLAMGAAVRALALSEADLRQAQEVARIGSWRLNPASRALQCSAVTYRLYELENGSSVDLDLFLGFVHPDDLAIVRDSLTVLLAGRPVDVEHRVVVGGKVRWVRQRGEPMLSPDGEVLAVVGTAEDVTERRIADEALRDSEERYRLLVQHAPVGIMHFDTDWRIVYCNQRLADILHAPWERLAQMDLRNIRDHSIHPAVEAALAGRTASYEGTYQSTLSGHTIWVAMTCSPLKDAAGAIIGGSAVVEDRTEHHRRELELHAALDRLSTSNAELERFAYVASHDLQEPLRTITSFAQLLERRFLGRLDDEGHEYIRFITEAAGRMYNLINDLLAYSRVTGQGRPLEPIDAGRACALALENLGESIREAGASVEIGPLPKVVGDEGQLAQLFQNLLGNAIKYRRPGETPRIEVWAKTAEDGQWEFAVADNGIGIETTGQDIFEIFRRLHSNKAYPGTGVGLAICKRIIQRHGGRIWHENRPEGGAVFKFTLPTA